MSAEENKVLVRRFVEEFWNEGNTATADELMAVDAEIHMPTGEVVSLDELKGFAGAWRGAFPDWHSTFEELIAEGDRVAERWTGRGTHRGELQGIPPTGKRVEVPGSVGHDEPDAAVGRCPGARAGWTSIPVADRSPSPASTTGLNGCLAPSKYTASGSAEVRLRRSGLR